MYRDSKKIAIFLFITISFAVALWYFSLWPREDGGVKCKDCNLIMISLSNVSAENMSLYGYERLTTPNLDEWAKDAVVFENAFTQTSWTLPVATSLFTSLYPYSHKIMNRFVDNVLDENIQTLPELLSAQGYKTAAFVGGLDYSNSFGHMRGFEDFEEAMQEDVLAISFSGFGPTLAKGLEWIEENPEEKFFLFLHGYDAHCPFDPPAAFKSTFSSSAGKDITVDHKLCLRGFKDSENESYEAYYYREGAKKKVTMTKNDITYLEDLYDEEVLSVDALVGSFLNNLDKTTADNTIVIVFSDHGEMFAKHGRFGRAGGVRGTLYDEVVHIPMIMKIPKQNGKRISGLLQMIDVMPSLLDILGLKQPEGLQGKNAAPLIAGEIQEINDYVFTGSEFGIEEGRLTWPAYTTQSVNESLRSKGWKLIYEAEVDEKGKIAEETYELYNLNDDPDELHNLTDKEPVEAARFKKILKNWASSAKSYDAETLSVPQLLPPEIIESSKEHGYW